MASITLENVYVDGVNAYIRSHSMKQWLLTYSKLAGQSVRVPILQGVDLQINEGEKVGVIGRNGSGKSSLLKAIAGIYPPKSGTVTVAGKVVPMIEMGLGFEPELTGRDNIRVGLLYNGSFDEYSPAVEQQIIELSGLGEKIDLPFKVFSSGMAARLSFAVGIFNNPEILLLDEIFAPGDENFIKTSMKIMTDKFFSASISMLVTHNTELVKQLCERCLWIDQGKIRMDGKPDEVIPAYSDDAYHDEELKEIA